MEEQVKLGSVGSLDLSFSGGKATVSAQASYGPTGTNFSLSVVEDAKALVDLLFAAIEKASPAGSVPIEEAVKIVVKNAVAAIG